MAFENEKIEMILLESEERMEKSVSVLKSEYAVIRAGRANPHILDKVLVDYYGTPTPINQTSNISVQEGFGFLVGKEAAVGAGGRRYLDDILLQVGLVAVHPAFSGYEP